MEYERIRKVQIGILSPTKLRMKLLGPRNSTRKEANNSSKTSPSKNDDMKFARNSLLSDDVDDEESSMDISRCLRPDNVANSEASGAEFPDKKASTFSTVSRPQSEINHATQNCCASIPHQAHSNNLCIIHPLRSFDEGGSFHNNGNDVASSFEFHRGERTIQQSSVSILYRHVPSKWNDAEKWIMNRQIMTNLKKKAPHNHLNHQTSSTLQRVDTDSTIAENKPSIKQTLDNRRTELNQTSSLEMVEKFSFIHHGSNGKSVESANSAPYSSTSHSSLIPGEEKNYQELSIMRRHVSEPIAVPTMQSVSMRDIGTEMTPVPTPLGSITPTRSSVSSLPSTPRPGAVSSFPTDDTKNAELDYSETKGGKDKLTESEVRLKIRREIAALGIQLGKTNIVSWASKEVEQCSISPKTPNIDTRKKEYEACAAAWEEAENTKHMARYKQEEVKIQAWQNHQKAKIEAKMNNIEAKAQQTITRVNAKMAEKLSMTQEQVKKKQAAAQVRMNKQAARVSHKAAHIRRTGQVPSANFLCCSGFF
ncbi:hypothetical protein Cni_G24995 [Canna indica]|uniref:Remorin C-terminal domain-containing protein n=1 Tax=Canna indica TaxID=4628 RepID=A0AAQ3QNT0_9LILI|nr:hypothetical protein Cni_G24995 [Canna indica]